MSRSRLALFISLLLLSLSLVSSSCKPRAKGIKASVTIRPAPSVTCKPDVTLYLPRRPPMKANALSWQTEVHDDLYPGDLVVVTASTLADPSNSYSSNADRFACQLACNLSQIDESNSVSVLHFDDDVACVMRLLPQDDLKKRDKP